MKKVLEGWELLKEISEGNIKEGTKFKIIQKYGNYTYAKLYKTGNLLNLMNEEFENPLVANWLIDTEFEIIEEPKEINIQDIEEMNYLEDCECDTEAIIYRDKINEIIKAIKQIDNKLNREYCEVELDKNNKALNNMCNECKYGIDWEER